MRAKWINESRISGSPRYTSVIQNIHTMKNEQGVKNDGGTGIRIDMKTDIAIATDTLTIDDHGIDVEAREVDLQIATAQIRQATVTDADEVVARIV